jgi:hypothetical protein
MPKLTKEGFHRKYRKVLREVAAAMRFPVYEVRSNKGGPAITGEVILHTPTLYVQVSGFEVGGCHVMYRSCRGMTDYTGGRNRWMKLATLDGDRAKAVQAFQEASDASGTEPRW